MTPHGTQAIVSRPISGLAILSLLAALVAVATLTTPAVALGCGIVGVLLALLSRRRLILQPELRGSRVALAGVLLAGFAVLVSAPGVIVGVWGFVARAVRLHLG